MDFHLAPKIFEIFELCISGQAFKIFRLSSLAHTMKAFIGRFMCGLFSLSRFEACCRMILALSEFSLKLGSGAPHTGNIENICIFWNIKVHNNFRIVYFLQLVKQYDTFCFYFAFWQKIK